MIQQECFIKDLQDILHGPARVFFLISFYPQRLCFLLEPAEDGSTLKRNMILEVIVEDVDIVETVIFSKNGGENCVPRGVVDKDFPVVDEKNGENLSTESYAQSTAACGL